MTGLLGRLRVVAPVLLLVYGTGVATLLLFRLAAEVTERSSSSSSAMRPW